MNLDFLTVCAFLSFSLGFFLLGKRFVGLRNRGDPRRPLVFGTFTHTLALTLPLLTDRDELRKDLRRAGFYHRHALPEFLALRNALVFGWLLLTAATYWVIAVPSPSWKVPIVALGAVSIAVLFSLPRLVLQALAGDRLRRIERTLPDAVDMITMVMTGGISLERALEHVSRELASTHPDLACEMTIVTRQTQAASLDYALRQFADRIDTPDVQSLASLVSQTERLGSNVATAFQSFADSARLGMRQRAAERGNKASVKLLLPIIFCLAPPVYILLLAPALLELRRFVIEQNQPGGALVQDIDVTRATLQGEPSGSDAD